MASSLPLEPSCYVGTGSDHARRDRRRLSRSVTWKPMVAPAAGRDRCGRLYPFPVASMSTTAVHDMRGAVIGSENDYQKKKKNGAEQSSKRCSRSPAVVSYEVLDGWMKETVPEIVKNIGEAPFLVHVYSNEEQPATDSMSNSTIKLQREPAVAEEWICSTKRWGADGCCDAPDGIILVEELVEGGHEGEGKGYGHSSTSRTWGVLVQGRGGGCAACYILDTSRVWSSLGWCTHFCLVRAKCFGDAAPVQLRKAWLQP